MPTNFDQTSQRAYGQTANAHVYINMCMCACGRAAAAPTPASSTISFQQKCVQMLAEVVV